MRAHRHTTHHDRSSPAFVSRAPPDRSFLSASRLADAVGRISCIALNPTGEDLLMKIEVDRNVQGLRRCATGMPQHSQSTQQRYLILRINSYMGTVLVVYQMEDSSRSGTAHSSEAEQI